MAVEWGQDTQTNDTPKLPAHWTNKYMIEHQRINYNEQSALFDPLLLFPLPIT